MEQSQPTQLGGVWPQLNKGHKTIYWGSSLGLLAQ